MDCYAEQLEQAGVMYNEALWWLDYWTNLAPYQDTDNLQAVKRHAEWCHSYLQEVKDAGVNKRAGGPPAASLDIWVVQVGEYPVVAYTNAIAAKQHQEAIWLHPDLPNKSWARCTRLQLLASYRPVQSDAHG